MKLLSAFISLFGFFLFPPSFVIAQHTETLYEKGFEFAVEGQSDEAIDFYKRALKQRPDWAEIHHNLGVLYFGMGRGVEAVSHFLKAKKLYSKSSGLPARRNLEIVQTNLRKTYAEFRLDPKEFEALPVFSNTLEWKPVSLGFLVGEKGYLLAPYHVSKDAKYIRAKFLNGSQVPLIIVKNFIVHDFSLFRLREPINHLSTPLVLADSSQITIREPVYGLVFNTPGGKNPVFCQGMVLDTSAFEANDKVFQFNFSIATGQSGAPLWNGQGEVVGMAFSLEFMERAYSRVKDLSRHTGFGLKSGYLMEVLAPYIKFKDQDRKRIIDNKNSLGNFSLKIKREIQNSVVWIEVAE